MIRSASSRLTTSRWKRWITLCFAVPQLQAVVINEFMASNGESLADGDGNYSDWIELHNPGPELVELDGYYLTDKADELTKWQFPAGTDIPSGGYLILFASGADSANYVDGSGYLHTTFSLSKSGEYLALVDPDETTVTHSYAPSFPEQERDISYGLFGGEIRYFSTPTPGAANQDAIQNQVADTVFSRKRGFYNAPFSVSISTDTEGATIRYTLDGSDPTPTHGTIYSVPIPVDSITTLRAMAYKPGWQETNIDTQTYLFVDQVKDQSPNGTSPGPGWPEPYQCTGICERSWMDYGMDPTVVNDPAYASFIDDALLAIPTLSMVTDLDNLFDPATGIYEVPWGKGKDWERPTSIELIHPDNSEGFQIDCGMRLRGSSSANLDNPKHAFRFFFRSEYGDSSLRYPLFGDEGADEFQKIDLRTSQNFSWARGATAGMTMNREVLWRDTQRDMGQPYTRSRYYHLYINGHYWGIFQTQERAEAAYGSTYFGGDREDYDTIKANANAVHEVGSTDGNEDAWTRLWEACNSGFTNDNAYYNSQGLDVLGSPDSDHETMIDLDNLIDYMLIVFFSGNIDGPLGAWSNDTLVNNYYAVYNRKNPTGWKHFVHDYETSMSGWGGETRLTIDRTGPFGTGSVYESFSAQWIHEQMMAHPEYRMAFADRVQRHCFLDGALTTDQLLARFHSRTAELDMAIIAESARWGDTKREQASTRNNDWIPSVNDIANNYLPNRGSFVINQLKADGLFPNTPAPILQVNGANQHGGYISPGETLTMINPGPTGVIYYTLDGTDPRHPERLGGSLESVPLVDADAQKKVFIPTGEISSDWQSDPGFDDSTWLSGSSGIGYDRGGDYDPAIGLNVYDEMYRENSTCYIRIPFTVDLADLSVFNQMTLSMRYDDGFIAYLNGVEIERDHIVGAPEYNSRANTFIDSTDWVTFDVSSHLAHLQDGPNVLAIQGLNQSSGSSDFLINAALEISTTLTPGGGGVAPEAITYSGGIPVDGTTEIKARVLNGGEWSALSEAVYTDTSPRDFLRISELMYNPEDAKTEFVELKNTSSQAIKLDHLQFTEGIFFTFPSMTLAPGEHVVIVEDLAAFVTRYPDAANKVAGEYSGSLSNGGEDITIVDATGSTIQQLRYQDDWYPASDNEGFSLTVRDPYSSNRGNLGNQNSWRLSSVVGGSPGTDDTNLLPLPGSIVINEILAHSNPGNNWIELHNTTSTAISVGGWFLSNDEAQLKKYQIAEGTVVPASGFLVLHENQDFNQAANPRSLIPFSLDENGGQLVLSSGQNSEITGYREAENYAPSQLNFSQGRHEKSDGTIDFVALREQTPDSRNAYPLVGPIVITEIQFAPNEGVHALEYLELRNISESSVTLHEATQPWNFASGIEFTFPDSPAITLLPGSILILAKSPGDFTATYGNANGAQIIGPFIGYLNDEGERIELKKGNILIEGITFSVDSPWPSSPEGWSLHRKVATGYGNDPANWQAGPPQPGISTPESGDIDSDGLTDLWEIENGTNLFEDDAHIDGDDDGQTHLEEFLAGTNPWDPESQFQVTIDNFNLTLSWNAIENRVYTVERSTSLDEPFEVLQTGITFPTNQFTDPSPPNPKAFYRVRVNLP